MKQQITVKEHEGKFLLVGRDGYSTTAKKWNTRAEADKAQAREQKLSAAGKPSNMKWEY